MDPQVMRRSWRCRWRREVPPTLVVLCGVLPLLVSACRERPAHLEVAGRILAPAIRECSGIVASRQHEGVFWVHNDSGSEPELFAVDRSGELLCAVDVQGAENIDWEDITTDDAGNLYVGDFGNNRNKRRDLAVLVIAEPDPAACRDGRRTVPVARRIPFHFPEQRGFPDVSMNFDCEALFWHDGDLYVFTKHRSDTHSVLYRLPADATDTVAVRLGAFDAGGMVTAASLAPDGRRLVVLTYDFLHEFSLDAGSELLAGAHRRMLLEARQCEAVCFDGSTVVVVNEQREIYRIVPGDWGDELLPASPAVRVPVVADAALEAVPWSEVPILALVPELEQGQLPTVSPPELRVTRSAHALYGRVLYGNLPPDASGPLVVVHLGPDAGRRARIAHPDDRTWEILVDRAQWRVTRQDEGSPNAVPARVVYDGAEGVLTFRLPLPTSLERQETAMRLNVILRRPGSDGPAEWAWGATSTTRPGENVLLWGRLTGG